MAGWLQLGCKTGQRGRYVFGRRGGQWDYMRWRVHGLAYVFAAIREELRYERHRCDWFIFHQHHSTSKKSTTNLHTKNCHKKRRHARWYINALRRMCSLYFFAHDSLLNLYNLFNFVEAVDAAFNNNHLFILAFLLWYSDKADAMLTKQNQTTDSKLTINI